jgi:hypothetical protein
MRERVAHKNSGFRMRWILACCPNNNFSIWYAIGRYDKLPFEIESISMVPEHACVVRPHAHVFEVVQA